MINKIISISLYLLYNNKEVVNQALTAVFARFRASMKLDFFT